MAAIYKLTINHRDSVKVYFCSKFNNKQKTAANCFIRMLSQRELIKYCHGLPYRRRYMRDSSALRPKEREMARRCRIGIASTTRCANRRERARHPSCYFCSQKETRAILPLVLSLALRLFISSIFVRVIRN